MDGGSVVVVVVAFIMAIVSALLLLKWNPISRLQGLPAEKASATATMTLWGGTRRNGSSPRDFFQSPFLGGVRVYLCVPGQLNMQ